MSDMGKVAHRLGARNIDQPHGWRGIGLVKRETQRNRTFQQPPAQSLQMALFFVSASNPRKDTSCMLQSTGFVGTRT